MKSINDQKPATKNQITNNKPDIIKNFNVLQGYLGNSFNGGMLKPIAYAPIMAGTKVADYTIKGCIRMLTPKTPVYQKLKLVLKTFFVPNIRVWKNAEKFLSQKGGANETKVKEIPNIGGYKIDYMTDNNEQDIEIVITDTDLWRDSYVSSYIPKYQTGSTSKDNFSILPKYSVLPLRGFKAIYNDFLRNKEYDKELEEYFDDTVTNGEWMSYIPYWRGESKTYDTILRGKRQNSYYTDYRTEMLGENTEIPTNESGQPLLNLSEFLKTVSELRSEAQNAQANDWDIIAKIRGSRKLTQGRVQLLGTREIGLNYQMVTQDTYNTNEEITKDFQVLGEQGAYCFTNFEVPMFQGQEFIEEGYIHTIAQVTADTVFETGFERTGLNVGAFDIWRPDLEQLKEDILLDIEKCGTRITSEEELSKVTGYKRKYSEYFKAPNIINGDITTGGAYITKNVDGMTYIELNDLNDPIRLESKRTFQFFEQDDKETGRFEPKNTWQDYTDILINRNQAIMQQVVQEKYMNAENQEDQDLIVKGDNQLFMIGLQTIVCDQPISENIKNNYTQWGEE